MANQLYLAKVKFPLTEKPVTDYSAENQKVYQDVFNIQNTLRLVLSNFTEDAPADGNKYVRQDQNWVPEALVDPGIPEAPVDNKEYARKNASWVLVPPSGIPEAPINGNLYGRKDAAWTLIPSSSGIPEAPNDGKLYGRKNSAWVQIDITPPSNTDPYWASVVLLMHYDGTNGGTVFSDSSAYNKTTTRYGSVVTDTAQVKFGNASAKFTSAGDMLLTQDDVSLNLTGDFTIELWLYSTSSSGFVINKGGGQNIAWSSYEILFSSGYLQFAGSSANAGYDIGSETTTAGRIGQPTLNTWNHVAVTRQGNTYRGFLNGVKGFEDVKALTPYNSTGRGLCVGGFFVNSWGSTPQANITGYIDELRITKGVARYALNFTPPTSPFPNS